MKVSVPAGTAATVYVPAAADQSFVATSGAATPTGRVAGYQVFSVEPGDVTFAQGSSTTAPVGGTVPATLSLSLGTPAAFGAFTPGVARTYTASTTATMTSTAGDATLSVTDPSTTTPGHLANGAFRLAQPLRVRATNAATPGSPFASLGSGPLSLLTWTGPASNDALTIGFEQQIGASEPLRTGSYGKTLTYTLSTTTP